MTDCHDDIHFDVHDGLATITIRREAKRNALARVHFRDLLDLLDVAEASPASAIVLTGEGEKAFCAGADLSADEGFFENIRAGGSTGLGDVLRRVRRLSKPLVGRINGHCYAGGVGLLAACDLAVAVEDARFALPEVKVGLFPFVVLAGLHGAVAPRALSDLALTGEAITAGEAHRIGLVARCVPRAELDAAVRELAAKAACVGGDLLRDGRAALSGIGDDAFEARIAEAEQRTFLQAERRSAAGLVARL